MNPATFKKLLQAKRFIARNYNRGFNLNEIAGNVGLSKYHLSRNFKKVFGETMYQFHARMRISKATKWICKRDFEISDIAWNLGFPDLSTFSKFFKKDLNLSPRKFKQLYKKDNVMFLNELYRSAKKSVFATSNLEFFPFWQSDLGEQLIQSHLEAKTQVTRVFLFDNYQTVTGDHFAIMDSQFKAGIKVRILFLDNKPSLKKHMDNLNGFAIIDDKIAGITKSFDTNNTFTSKWIFKTPGILNELNQTRKIIEETSLPYEEFKSFHRVGEERFKYAINFK